MNVNPSIGSLYQTNLTRQTRGYGQLAKGKVEAAASEKMDRLSISSHGSFQREVSKVVKGIVQDIRAWDTDQCPSRAKELAADMERGAYQVSSQDLADAILGRAMGK